MERNSLCPLPACGAVGHSFLVRRGGLNGEEAGTAVQFGIVREFYAAHPDGQIVPRKFKAIVARLPGLTERFLELSDFGGFFEGLFAGFGTLLLELFQLGFGFLEGAVEAMLVKREADEEITMLLEGFGLGEAAIDEGVGDISASWETARPKRLFSMARMRSSRQ